MMGRVGTVLGEAGINIISAAVGRHPNDEQDGGGATMLVTTDAAVGQDVVERIATATAFWPDVRSVSDCTKYAA